MGIARILSFFINGRVFPSHMRDPEIRELNRFVGPGNRFHKAQEVLERPRSAEDRSWLIDQFSRDYPLAPHELRWAEAEPSNPLGHMLAGSVGVRWAWKARTSRAAEDVSGKRWVSFFERLEITEQYLRTAIRLDDQDPVPYVCLMAVLLGRGGSREEANGLFQRAVALSPEDYSAHTTMLAFTCEKWGGSDAEMRSFVGRVVARAPLGSPLHTLVPALLVEEYIALAMRADPNTTVAVLNQPHFRTAVTRAHDAYLRRPDRRVVRRELAHRNDFAATLAWAGAHERACEELDHIRGRIMEMPWLHGGWHSKVMARHARRGTLPQQS